MTSMLQSFWTGAVRPPLQRPLALQVAALCHRTGKAGVEILLVTSSRGRWILPKGWPIEGLTPAEAAKQEAWEEAGVKSGDVSDVPFGTYVAEKRFDNGAAVPCEIQVHLIAVKEMSDSFPEANKRERKWIATDKAAELVDEPGLRQLLLSFDAPKS